MLIDKNYMKLSLISLFVFAMQLYLFPAFLWVVLVGNILNLLKISWRFLSFLLEQEQWSYLLFLALQGFNLTWWWTVVLYLAPLIKDMKNRGLFSLCSLGNLNTAVDVVLLSSQSFVPCCPSEGIVLREIF